uniref:Uncharacterized protein n=1 Tax=Zea mays TaxID=4577 RepID=C4J0D5_MAIZE|nr:unknown [Zea mays]
MKRVFTPPVHTASSTCCLTACSEGPRVLISQPDFACTSRFSSPGSRLVPVPPPRREISSWARACGTVSRRRRFSRRPCGGGRPCPCRGCRGSSTPLQRQPIRCSPRALCSPAAAGRSRPTSGRLGQSWRAWRISLRTCQEQTFLRRRMTLNRFHVSLSGCPLCRYPTSMTLHFEVCTCYQGRH